MLPKVQIMGLNISIASLPLESHYGMLTIFWKCR